MCLILFSHKVIPGIALQLAANRDEFFARPTTPAAWWPDHPHILAGRDLQAGGTWLGVSRSGRYAALTNFRDPASRRDDAPSRGALISDFLLSEETPAGYLEQIAPRTSQYNGFSLLVGQGTDLWFLSNRGQQAVKVAPGIHGLSNHLLDEPWPKVTKGISKLGTLVAQPFAAEDYFSVLADETQASDAELPRTGIAIERERKSSAIRIRDAVYGTRCSTVLRIAEDGQVMFHERSFKPEGELSSNISHHFLIT